MAGFGVYVHVPFCANRCDYCDFATWTDRHHLMEAYAVACVTDLARRYDAGPVASARAAGFDNFNLDLIYGGAGETEADWRATLEAALALDPPHVSAYALTVEPGTPLARRIAAGEVAAPDDDDQAEKYLAAEAALSAAGRPWYEISNWARPGRECRHNLLYWAQGEYL